MDLSQVSSNKVTLNVLSPKDGGVSLNKGEMVKGLVQEISPEGLIMLVLKGKLIEAVSEVMVKPGQELYLMVDEFKNGKTYLKVVTPEMMGKLEEANITANLKGMGIAAKEETVLLSRKLLQHNMPVTQNNLNELAKATSLLGGSNPRNLEIAAFALSRGIDNKQAITALNQFLSPQQDISKLVTVITRLLNTMNSSPTPQTPANEMLTRASEPVSVNPGIQPPVSESISTSQGASQAGPSGQQNFPAGLAPGNEAASNKISPNSILPVNDSVANEPDLPVTSSTKDGSGTTGSDLTRNTSNNTNQPATTVNKTNVSNEVLPRNTVVIPVPVESEAQPKTPAVITGANNSDTSTDIQNNTDKTSLLAKGSVPAETISTEKTFTPLTQGNIISAENENELITIRKPNDSNIILQEGLPVSEGETIDTEDKLVRSVSELLKTLKDILELDPREATSRLGAKIKNHTQAEHEVLKALVLLEDLFNDKDLKEKLPVLRDLPQRLESLEKELSGQRLFNLSSRMPGDNFANYYYFSFPVKLDEGYSLCQLKVNKDSRRKLTDADNISFVVSLQTARLGMVLFHIEWRRQGELKLQGLVENQSVCDYFNRNIAELVDSLKGLGYKVINHGVKVSKSSDELNSLRPGLEEIPDKVRPFGIDVTV